jgi:hypothetical protein
MEEDDDIVARDQDAEDEDQQQFRYGGRDYNGNQGVKEEKREKETLLSSSSDKDIKREKFEH